MRLPLTIILLFFSSIIFAQKTKNTGTFWIKSTNSKTYKGRINTLNETSLNFSLYNSDYNFNIPINEIEKIKYRKKDKVWRYTKKGITIGASVGAGIGLIMAILINTQSNSDSFISNNPSFYITMPLAGGAFYGIIGGGIGSLIGLKRINISLDRNLAKYNYQKNKIEKLKNGD